MSKRDHFKEKQRPYMDRMVDRREPNQRFLIVCEGTRTEPNYFRSFRIRSSQIIQIDVQGSGDNTVSLVRGAIALRNAAIEQDEGYDQTWCVFDRDDFPIENFNRAMELAQQNDIQVAYSNQAFELWYLLHFIYLDTGIARHQYMERLNRFLETPYFKNDPNMFEILFEHRWAAIANAERLLREYEPSRPAADDPSTTVHLLVKELLRFFR